MTTADNSSALQLQGVTKRFGEVEAVSEVDLTLARGRVLALLGPNGAGKTTTVEMCEGFIRPDAGSIRVLGYDPVTQADALRSRIGIMLQGGGAYPGIRVGEMLDLVAKYSENPLDTEWLLQVVGLEKHRKTNYRRLSGGQQQRLSLACALVGRPELVFLDEPTAGLDAQSRLAVWDLIESMKRDGVTVVLTTHLMDEAEALSDDVVIIDRGRVIISGPTSSVTSGSVESGVVKQSTTVRVEGSLDVPGTAEALRRVSSGVNLCYDQPGHYSLQGEVTPDVLATFANACAEQSVLIRELKVGSRSLEDVFLDLTGREMRN